jgi:hypothetical protein
LRFLPLVDGLEVRALLSNVATVTNTNDSGPGSLRGAINNATSGEIINFARSAYGTITLTSGPLVVNMIDLTIDGPGAHKLTVSGGGKFTDFILFSILPPTDPPSPSFVPNTVDIAGLTIANGNASTNGFGGGGGILSFDALTISDSSLVNNSAPIDGGIGGAIYSGCCGNETLSAVHDLFTGNSVGFAGDTGGGFSQGGAIFNTDVATITGSTFVNNQALGPNALGGAIHTSFGSTLVVTGSTFQNNQAVGSQVIGGGAIWGDPAFVTVDSSKFLNNEAVGSGPFFTIEGGAIETAALNWNNEFIQVTESITNSEFSGNRAVGAAGSGAATEGGAIENGSGTLDLGGDTFVGNQSVGGSATVTPGGIAQGGAVFTVNCALNLTCDSFLGNQAIGGSSPMGVLFAVGGAVNSFLGNTLAPNPTSTISDSTFTGNSVAAGTGGGSFTITAGGAISYTASPVDISNSSFLGNAVTGSAGVSGGAGTDADGGAIWVTGSRMTIEGSLIAGNRAIGGKGGAAPGSTGGNGGNAEGGGIANQQGADLTLVGTTVAGNIASGGSSGQGSTLGSGGSGLGGGIETDAFSTLVASGGVLFGNAAIGGSGGGNGFGGAVYTLGTTTFTDTLFTLNVAAGGSVGGQGTGGGLYIAAGTTTLAGKTKVVGNFATTSNNDIFGPFGP